MKKTLSMLLLGTVLSQAAEVKLSGHILDSESKPVAGAVVTLASENLSDTTDAMGAYSLTNTTATVLDMQTPKQSMLINKQNLHLSLAEPSSVSLKVFTVAGRLISQTSLQNLESGSHKIPLFEKELDHSLAAAVLVMQATINNKTFTTKFLPNSNTQSISFDMPLVASQQSSNNRLSTRTVDTLSVYKKGQKIMNLPLTSLMQTLPDYYIVQRDISGGFSDVSSKGIGYIQAVVTSDDLVDGGRIDLWYNQPNNSYSGFMYTSHTAETKDYALYIEVFSQDSLIIGRSNTTNFTTVAGDIAMPDFNPDNGARTMSINAPLKAKIGETLTITRTVNSPLIAPDFYRWKGGKLTVEAGINDPFVITYQKVGIDTIRSFVAYPDGYSDSVEVVILIEDTTSTDPIIDSLTIAQLDSISKLPDFYNADYRPDVYDSLGVRGGELSGGFLDSFDDETQLQIALSGKSFTLNNVDVTFASEPTGTHYWMALALGQEYFNVDLQLMAAKGAKETFTGTNLANPDYLTTTEFSPFHIEAPSGLDRALNFYPYFPKYKTQLEAASDITSSGINSVEFLTFYCNKKKTHNTGHMVNSVFIASLFHFLNYDMLHYATDIKWDETLINAKDPYFGTAALLIMYVNGAWGQMANLAGLMDKTSWSTTAADPNARTLMGTGNNNYLPETFKVVQYLIDDSRESLTDPTIAIMDNPISLDQLKQIYFGDNGTVETQGDGGLLLHYNLTPEQRTEIDGILTNAFNLLKGRAPSITGQEAVSLRYDFLPIIRTVKKYFPFERTEPTKGDAGILIPQYSTGK